MKKIALLGDSLVDTLFFGGNFWELKMALEKNFPDEEFELLNYGVGSTDAELGLFRLTNDYEYKERGRQLPALINQKPDITIVGCFSYNHKTKTDQDLNEYRETIRKIVESLQTETESKVWLYIAMAPNKENYTTGIPWLGWSEEKRIEEYETTCRYQQEFLELAVELKLPLIDGHSPSLKDGDGDPKFISNVDFIHPSAAMRKLVADLVVKQLLEEKI